MWFFTTGTILNSGSQIMTGFVFEIRYSFVRTQDSFS